MRDKLFPIIALLIFFVSCNQSEKKSKGVGAHEKKFFQPPIPKADLPFEEYSVDAQKGDTLFYQTGSIILFPPHSFVDQEGNLVQGNVQVKYREFRSPIDYYLSGIPMTYDSLGKQYVFESSGMCEILAYKEGVPVFVNPLNKPEIHLVSQYSSSKQSIYYLDTTQKRWINRGPSIVTDLTKKTDDSRYLTNLSFNDIEEPLKPEKATKKSPIIKIAIDPASFKELMVYNNLQFQIDPGEKNFNPGDSAEEWTDIELVKGSTKGLYTIKFSNSKRTVSYAAKPVLEGNDYEKALKVFDKKTKEYQKKLKQRVNTENANKEQYFKDSLAYSVWLEENKRIERLNKLVEIRNKEIEKQNAKIEKINKETIDANQSIRLMRSLKIDRFGIWNCDVAIFINSFPIVASFKDNAGNPLELTNIAVIHRSLNGIVSFFDNRIGLVDGGDNMIIGINNGRFAYITYSEYNKLKINADTKEQTFTMTVVDEKDNNYDFIKAAIGER